jgi:hypothetical protein
LAPACDAVEIRSLPLPESRHFGNPKDFTRSEETRRPAPSAIKPAGMIVGAAGVSKLIAK